MVMGGAGTLAAMFIDGNRSAGPVYAPTLAGHALPALHPVVIFCAGLGCGFLVWFGVWLIASAVARRRAGQYDDPIDTFLPGRWRAP
ncbi:MAG TPA: hypothetical protein VE442_22655 [Jatrophihabitans sp.]|nr:hypothetical protein [Jatrophihabitans sp.]